MELLAVLILLSGFLSLSSAFKLVQKLPTEYPTIYSESNSGSILPYAQDQTESEVASEPLEAFKPKMDKFEYNENTIQPRHRRSNRRNLRSLLNSLRGQKSVVNPLCYFTALPCRSLRKAN